MRFPNIGTAAFATALVLLAAAPLAAAHPDGRQVTTMGAGDLVMGYVVVRDFYNPKGFHCRMMQIILETDGQPGPSGGDRSIHESVAPAPGTNNPCPLS